MTVGMSRLMSRLELFRAVALIAFACVLTPGVAPAQEFINPAESATAAPDAGLPPKITDRLPVEIDEATLANALSTGPLPGASTKPWHRKLPQLAATWSKTDNKDGSASYSVNKALATPWPARIGADISTAPPPPDPYDPRQLPGTTSNAGAGSAWANLMVPHVATIEVRAEPANGYDKFGTKLERSLPLGKSLSLTGQTSVGVTDLHPMVAPGIAAPAADATMRLYNTDNSLQLNILPTGTTLLAGATVVTGDPVTHSRVSAAQKIYGPLNVTGAIYDPGQPGENMSITAGMSFAW
jgi:hypothetical protein